MSIQYFGQDLETVSITTTVDSTSIDITAGAKNVVNLVQSVNINPSDVRQEGTPLKATSVKHRHIRTDDTVRVSLFADDSGLVEHLIKNRNTQVSFTILPWSTDFVAGTDVAPTFTDTLGLLTFAGMDIVDGATVANFDIINIEIAASS